jgi:hypothetical protein
LLAELGENLWAVDCQTCDRPLGRRSPSVTVAAIRTGVAEVALVATDAAGGSGWRLASLDAYLAAGMELGWPERMLPGLTGSLEGGTLTIGLDYDGTRLGSWSTSLPEYAGAEVRRHDMVLVGVTTAVDVTTGVTHDLVNSLIERRRLALAWARVRTTPGDLASVTGLIEIGEDVDLAVQASFRNDGSLIAALGVLDRFHAVAQAATAWARVSRDRGDLSDGVHIVVRDKMAGLLIAEISRPVLEVNGLTFIFLPDQASWSRSDVVIGTPEQFATRSTGPAAGALQAFILNVTTDALPPDFPHRYQRILEI